MKLSKHLEHISAAISGKVSLGEIVDRMRHAGFGLIIMFLSLPFMQPVPMAGLSTAFGAIIALLGLQMVLKRKTVWIPEFIAKREITERVGHSLLGAATKFFKFIETLVRPRLDFIARRETFIGIVIFVSALVLMLPIPIPFSNIVCAVPIALMSLALLEKDGVMAILGFLGCLFSIAFHVVIFVVGIEGFKALMNAYWP